MDSKLGHKDDREEGLDRPSRRPHPEERAERTAARDRRYADLMNKPRDWIADMRKKPSRRWLNPAVGVAGRRVP